MGSIRESLQAQPKTINKIIETPNQAIEIKKISNKIMLSTSKVKRSQKFVWRLPTEFVQAQPQIPKKNYQNTKSTNQDEHFTKKVFLVT
jgi:hypothetical protein